MLSVAENVWLVNRDMEMEACNGIALSLPYQES
jgi:hypothetical protein